MHVVLLLLIGMMFFLRAYQMHKEEQNLDEEKNLYEQEYILSEITKWHRRLNESADELHFLTYGEYLFKQKEYIV